MIKTKPKIGLVMTGGGARSAYQVGVLRAISEFLPKGPLPFSVLSGVSAGAINTIFMASTANDFQKSTRKMWEMWANLRPDQVFRADVLSLSRIGTSWIASLSSGGLFKSTHGTYLLDTTPLRKLLESTINIKTIGYHFEAGLLHEIAVSATNYYTGTAVTFFEGAASIEPWQRSARISTRVGLTIDHVMASCALPVFFPAIALNGSYYGDGCIRLTAPLSPAIHMEADRVLAIGIRYPRSIESTMELNIPKNVSNPTLADIVGVLLNAVFLDNLETDIERMERINRTVTLIPEQSRGRHPHHLRVIPLFTIRPTKDLGSLASDLFNRFPIPIKYVLRGVGASQEKGWDLSSYLAFDQAYTCELLELGYQDAMDKKAELIDFLV